MTHSDREVEPHFSNPTRQVTPMLVVLGLSGAGAFMALPKVLPVFQANPYLNGFILFVFAIGVLACFWQVLQLIGSRRWIQGFAADLPGHEHTHPPQLLKPLATLLRQRGRKQTKIASTSARSILDSVAQRIDEAREITRYIVNMLIFLGLLGTFYGLATTVPAVVETIRSLAPKDGETGVEVFNRLMTGLESQLGGMGVAFASSLLGLTGSLVVGLLELFAGHGQNRFYRELEEWVSTITRVGLAGGGEGDTGAEAGVLAGTFEVLSEQLESLQMMLTRADVTRALTEERLDAFAGAVDRLDRHLGDMATADAVLTRLSEGQERLIACLEPAAEAGAEGLDAQSRMHLRSIDRQLLRILEELSAGRQDTMAELRLHLSDLIDEVVQLQDLRPGPVSDPVKG